ncbi:cyanocobalamin reductase / alkylcobalamin dealkylase-like isoform X6 [Penaeus japonicus]|uniref:cyanocobalamin reductase / alkylcobalamin dealkylase-like isoform X6 n=1 Tax=Penaeus japonicus TaxID=27405 RepID=UPI001C70B197|nr:cyanocobalamin reductase / alkylcobalamin dealkylase-like isoform X6 [Penaeus japonicus]
MQNQEVMEKTEEIKKISLVELKEISIKLDLVLTPCGFEFHPFKVGWYNEQVAKSFCLPYHEDTLVYVVISTPSMFEKAFLPFVTELGCLKSTQDPLDQCMVHCFSGIKKAFPSESVITIHDFELSPSRRPKVLVQTAGHVAGAVRYYQRKDLKSDPWDPKKKVFGVCLHPLYGGWFALRGVVIFPQVVCPELKPQKPKDILQSDEELLDLLKRYNDHWQDWTFRDIIPVQRIMVLRRV